MPAPRVYNKHYRDAPPDAVYIGRGSSYGNRFVIGEHGDRDQVCNRFECEQLPDMDVSALVGKNLVCFCAPHRCHGDSIKGELPRGGFRWPQVQRQKMAVRRFGRRPCAKEDHLHHRGGDVPSG